MDVVGWLEFKRDDGGGDQGSIIRRRQEDYG